MKNFLLSSNRITYKINKYLKKYLKINKDGRKYNGLKKRMASDIKLIKSIMIKFKIKIINEKKKLKKS